MRKVVLFLAAILLSLGMSGGYASAGVDVGVSIGEEGLRSFYLAIGDYFRVPQREVVVIRERHVRDHEIPVVLFLAKHARVEPRIIIDMRLGGRSWMDIIFHYHLSPEILYVPVHEVKGPPYGKAYGHYKKHKHNKKWKAKDLDDDDVVNLVNLRFVSEHYGYSADAVVKMRESGRDFVVIHDEVRKGKGHRHEDGDDDGKGHGKKEKHKEKHKGHGKDKD